MKFNRKFKDSVFTALFNDPDLLRELYGALGGVTLPQDVSVSINTLENVLYMDLYNDISFEIGGKLIVLIEHQSTVVNPNMALRMLLYITRVLEKNIKGRNLYSGKPLLIPWPEFFVLYNGSEAFPDEKVLRLSDLFETPIALGLPEKVNPLLELEVKVLNINKGRNEEIVNRCKMLAEYSAFTAKARNFLKELVNKKEAIEETVKYCLKYGILNEFLEKHGSEVLNMLLTEWNMEDCIAVRCEEAREEAWEKARVEVRAETQAEEKQRFLELLDQGLTIEEIKKRL